jgi:hypothetical protein
VPGREAALEAVTLWTQDSALNSWFHFDRKMNFSNAVKKPLQSEVVILTFLHHG